MVSTFTVFTKDLFLVVVFELKVVLREGSFVTKQKVVLAQQWAVSLVRRGTS